jgi:bla regulator protein BlaR1
MIELGNHLWQSTLFAAAVALACWALRKNRARTRYWLWLAASLKFLVPFSLLVSMGGRMVTPAHPMQAVTATRVVQLSTSFAPMPPMVVRAASAPGRVTGVRWWPAVLGGIWLVGALIVTAGWTRRWLELRRIRRQSQPAALDFAIPVAISSAAMEPGVFGFIRPVLLLPEGLAETLSTEQFETVLVHEQCHVESRDNLTAALHLAVATLFWFHPAVWFIGRRLIEERERACDEAVLAEGNRPETYAQGILNICKFYRESPLPCAAGVTGADLKQRIREIMTLRASYRLTAVRKAVLAAGAVVAVAIPLAIGVLRAQTLPPAPEYGYEVVSVKRSDPGQTGSYLAPGPQGGLRSTNTSTMLLITFAYQCRDYQIVNAPGWVTADRFDISFTPDKPERNPEPGMPREEVQSHQKRNQQRMQAVLRDRFGLVLRAETREMPIYVMTLAKGGHKLSPPKDTKILGSMRMAPDELTVANMEMKFLAGSLSNLLGRYVRDDTGLTGTYDFKMKWKPDSSQRFNPPTRPEDANADDAGGGSIFGAMQEQLGLKLTSGRGPVPVFVVEKIEKPSEN